MQDKSTLPVQPQPVDETTTMALANCAAIAVGVVQHLSGTSISRTINSSPMTQEAIANMALQRLTRNLIKRSERASATGMSF